MTTPAQADRRSLTPENPPLLPVGFGLSYGESDVLATELPVQFGDASTTATLPVFDRAPQSPWLIELRSGGERSIVESSIQSLGAITTETFDDQVQEDARTMQFSGTDAAAFNFVSPFPRDLRAYAEKDGALVVTLRLESEVPDDASLTLYCGENCGVAVPVAEHLRALTTGEWQTLAFNVSCLQDLGLDMAKVSGIFGLASDEQWTVSFNDIRLEPEPETSSICL